MCATSGGGFALMTEAVGMAGMIETPIVCVDVQRAGPATGVPTKTEQGDLWQVLGAGQGDYPRIVVAPTNQLDLFHTMPERSEEHTSELQSRFDLVCRLLLEKKNRS